ncbi:MAG: hypothetical protein DMF84_00865 [Acidobacteria bacterium]|nr:MAG: hypothetical protein DMF84_00865 [Acidobacteriota bacterium]
MLILIVLLVTMCQAPAPPPAPAAQAPQPPSQASPAAQAAPKTVAVQTYPAEQVRAGAPLFAAQCGFCHGRDATGGQTGPDLTRSPLVAWTSGQGDASVQSRGGRPRRSRGLHA